MRIFVPWLVVLHGESSQKRFDLYPVMSDSYESKPALKQASRVALQAGTIGLIVSTVQNALGKHTHGAMGVFTRTGGTIGFFGNTIITWDLLILMFLYHLAAMGATFAFTEAFVANERQKNDALNGAAGGCAAGFLAGIRCRFIVTGVL